MSTIAAAVSQPAAAFHTAVRRDPEARLLNMAELRAIRAQHVPAYWFVPATVTRERQWHGRCSCGLSFMAHRSASFVVDNASHHLSDVLERAKGRKVAEAKAAAERARIDGEIEAALEAGHRAVTGA